MALKTEHTCDRCGADAPKGVRIEPVMWNDALPENVQPVRLQTRDLCQSCAQLAQQWFDNPTRCKPPGWSDLWPESTSAATCHMPLDVGTATEHKRDALTCSRCGQRTYNLHQPWCTGCGCPLASAHG